MRKILQFEQLKAFPELTHGVSTAEIGNLSYKWADANGQSAVDVRAARQQFFGFLSVSDKDVIATQVEGEVKIHDLGQKDRGKGVTDPETGVLGDGFFTQETNTNLFVITGDCLVLFFYEPVKGVCGLVHAGWRGVDQELPRKAIEYMVNHYGCKPSNIRVGISPGLQKQSAQFTHFDSFNQDRLHNWQPYIEKTKTGYQVDWIQYALDQLTTAGVTLLYIEDSAINTRTNPEYFSHRRSVEEKMPEARFGCLIGMKNTA